MSYAIKTALMILLLAAVQLSVHGRNVEESPEIKARGNGNQPIAEETQHLGGDPIALEESCIYFIKGLYVPDVRLCVTNFNTTGQDAKSKEEMADGNDRWCEGNGFYREPNYPIANLQISKWEFRCFQN